MATTDLTSGSTDPVSREPGTRDYIVRICDACYALKGQQCNDPSCVFCRRTMHEVGDYLDAMMLRPVVDGKRLDLHPLPTPPVECPYERIDDEALCRALRLKEGERVLVLQPFGWHIDGSHIPNAAEQFDREYVCAEHKWEVVHEFGPFIAIVRPIREVEPRP